MSLPIPESGTVVSEEYERSVLERPSQWRGKKLKAATRALHAVAGDLSGQVLGRLRVLHALEQRNRHGMVVWLCECECGVRKPVLGTHLRRGAVQSCGCLRRDKTRAVALEWKDRRDALPRIGQGPLRNHPLYRVWAGMVRRCENPKTRGWQSYGGRGVSVGAEWRHAPYAFVVWAVMNGWTQERRLVVDRIEASGDYEPGNCQMITQGENSRRAVAAMMQARRKLRVQRRALPL